VDHHLIENRGWQLHIANKSAIRKICLDVAERPWIERTEGRGPVANAGGGTGVLYAQRALRARTDRDWAVASHRGLVREIAALSERVDRDDGHKRSGECADEARHPILPLLLKGESVTQGRLGHPNRPTS
jgi:hypothetical protein